MRRGHWVIALLMGWALSLPSYAQTPPQPLSDREKLGYLGPIHRVIEGVIHYRLVGDEWIINATKDTAFANFNELGDFVSGSGINFQVIRRANPIISRTIHSATENKTEIIETNKYGTLQRKQVYQYDERNDLIEITYYARNYQITERDTYQYNDQHQLLLMSSYNESNKLVGQTQYLASPKFC